jgi:hypothetical protein
MPGDASAAPGVSAEFHGELAALRAYYAARIKAARLGVLPASAVAVAVQSIIGEQTIALRGLLARWQAATRAQRGAKPERPAGNAQRKNEDRKPPLDEPLGL